MQDGKTQACFSLFNSRCTTSLPAASMRKSNEENKAPGETIMMFFPMYKFNTFSETQPEWADSCLYVVPVIVAVDVFVCLSVDVCVRGASQWTSNV